MALYTSLKCLNTEVIAEDVMWRKAGCVKPTLLTPFMMLFYWLLNYGSCIHLWIMLSFVKNSPEISTERVEVEGVCSAATLISHTLVTSSVAYC